MQSETPKFQPYALSRFFILGCILLFTSSLNAQQKSPSKVYLQKKNSAIQLKDAAIATDNFFSTYKPNLGLTEDDQMKVKYARPGRLDQEHIKYEQFHQGIPVFGSAYNLHTKGGKVQSANGYYLPLITVNTQPRLEAAEAVEMAIEKMQADLYSWEDPTFKTDEKFGNKPTAALYIVSKSFPEPSEQYALAYVVEIFSVEPLDQQQYFIDAHSGEVLFNLPLLKHVSVPAKGLTKYYGEQTITVDSITPNFFVLQDLERGDGVITRNNELEVWTNNSNYWDFTNADQDEVAIDAHYCAISFYDYLLETFDWNGLGNNGEALETRVHAGDFVNAFWNGTYAAFGDGDCNHGPLTTLEVVAHEFAHGLTDYTSDLVYSGESGAINESMSDVFGKALEYKKDPAGFDWLIGESFKETPYTESFRSMEDPNARNHPKFYDGEFWTDGGGVHTNSSVGNHWFYLLVEGRAGVNEIGQSYSVQSLGMDKAMDIVFLTQSSYLTSNSTYHDYYEYSVMAAESIFGENSDEKEAVVEAWKAVGLPGDQQTNYDLAISFNASSTFICGQNIFYTPEVTVSNVGSVPYNPSTNGRFELNGNYIQPLNDPILPGESMTYVVNDYLFLGEGTVEFIDASLLSIFDDNPSNDQETLIVENGVIDSPDLGIENFDFVEKSCHSEMDSVRIRVINSSCSSISSGFFTLTINDPNSNYTWEKELELTFSLFPGRVRTIYTTARFPEGITDFDIEVSHPDDLNPNNNTSSFFYEPKNVISAAYLTEVNDQEFDLLEVNGFTSRIYDLNGDTYFAASSISTNPFVTICPDLEGTFDNNFFPASLSTCVDFSDWEAIPFASFDLIQFRSNEGIEDFTEIHDQTTITQANWKNETLNEVMYYNGQEEGEKVNNLIQLPEGFKGRVSFNFSSRLGDINSDEFLEYDANLFDNLSFFEEAVSTEDLEPSAFELFPNPGRGQYFIRHKSIPQQIQLLTAQGQSFRQIPVEGLKQTLNLQAIPDGYYFLQIRYDDQGSVTQPLIKLTN